MCVSTHESTRTLEATLAHPVAWLPSHRTADVHVPILSSQGLVHSPQSRTLCKQSRTNHAIHATSNIFTSSRQVFRSTRCTAPESSAQPTRPRMLNENSLCASLPIDANTAAPRPRPRQRGARQRRWQPETCKRDALLRGGLCVTQGNSGSHRQRRSSRHVLHSGLRKTTI